MNAESKIRVALGQVDDFHKFVRCPPFNSYAARQRGTGRRETGALACGTDRGGALIRLFHMRVCSLLSEYRPILSHS